MEPEVIKGNSSLLIYLAQFPGLDLKELCLLCLFFCFAKSELNPD